ncbi:MAG TPA: hypothetical protein PLE48_14000 [Thiobacillus sp.]|nr:hypothetical protein [Thiobacillus sp.]HQT71521.1 hypothetical protein [Thiobacillus sp.]
MLIDLGYTLCPQGRHTAVASFVRKCCTRIYKRIFNQYVATYYGCGFLNVARLRVKYSTRMRLHGFVRLNDYSTAMRVVARDVLRPQTKTAAIEAAIFVWVDQAINGRDGEP